MNNNNKNIPNTANFCKKATAGSSAIDSDAIDAFSVVSSWVNKAADIILTLIYYINQKYF